MQDIPRVLQNPKVYYRVRKSVTLVSILRQINNIHEFRPILEYPF